MIKDLISANPELQKSIEAIQAFKMEIDLIGERCKFIKITDEGSLSIGQQNLSKATQMINFIEEKAIAIKAPYWEACKAIDGLRKSIPKILNEGIVNLKEQIKNWELDKQKKAKEEQEVIETKLAANKELLLKQPLTNEIIENIIKIQSRAGKEKELLTLNTTKTKGVRYTWKFELSNIDSVPKEWLTLDENKVKEYIKDKKDLLKDGEIIKGIKFYKDIIITA